MQETATDVIAEIPGDSVVPLEAILCTDELHRRPWRLPDYEKENRALAALAQALADSPRTILQTLADTILEVLQPDSAGISLLTGDEKRFYWPAIAGVWKPHLGGGTPRDFGPCGDVLDRDAPLLFRHVERRYGYFLPVTPAVEEALLVPFYVAGRAVGTIWAIAHDGRRVFDAEDLRQLTSLGKFASSAYQAVTFLDALELSRADLGQRLTDVENANAAAQTLNVELGENERRFREMIDALPAAIYTTDAEGHVTHFNPACIELSGRVPTLGTDHWCVTWKLYHPDGTPMPHDACPMAIALKEGRIIRGAEAIAERPDGTRVWFTPYPTPLRDGDGRIVGGINMLVDITARKQAEEELRAADRHKDEFLATLAHELRNPLAPLSNALEILCRTEIDSAAAKRCRDMMQRQVQRLTRLVDDLIDVSRVSHGRIELRKGPVDLAALIPQAVETVQQLIDTGRHDLSVSLPPAPVYVEGDSNRLEQIISNLLNNASKYTDSGGSIRLTLAVQEHEAVLRLKDTGIGIAPEELSRIFDLFAQVDTSNTRERGGLGIGLSLVRQLVTLHGGSIEVHSDGLGHGSEFVIRLPLIDLLDADSGDKVSEGGESSTTRMAPTVPRRVLVVDDNADVAESEAMLLRLSGHEVRVTNSGHAALELAIDFRPEIVLLDIGMPGMDGYDVARAMRQHAELKHATLVALSGYGTDADRRRSEEAGFDAHFVKPPNLAALGAVMARTSKAV